LKFHFDRGLKLTDIDLGIDIRRRQPRGFVSHAHADHIAPHETAYGTPATVAMYRHRLGQKRRVVELPFHQPYAWDDIQLTTLPAGHMFGSSMLLAESANGSLLYTGDFKLGDSATAERAVTPPVDVLVMESTFGQPHYRWPDREEVLAKFFELIDQTLNDGRTPLVRCYVMGKSQEITKLLTDRGISVLQHPLAFEISKIYEANGCNLGDYSCYEDHAPPGSVVIAPPRSQKSAPLNGLKRITSFGLTGWAIDPNARFRLGVDHALPLSDHADYNELLEIIERTSPRFIYCTHGPAKFVDRLVDLGHNAYVLGQQNQLRLF